MIIQRITVESGQDPDEFVRFMRDEFLPAMRRGPTRIGQASYLELLQGNTQGTLDEFVLLVEGLMSFQPGFVGSELQEKFERFAGQLEGPSGRYQLCRCLARDAGVEPEHLAPPSVRPLPGASLHHSPYLSQQRNDQ